MTPGVLWDEQSMKKMAARLVCAGAILALVAVPGNARPRGVSPLSEASSAGDGNVPQTATSRALGTIKAIEGKTLTVTTDAGGELSVTIQDGARLLRVEPGEKDLKSAVPLALSELQSGDRVLLRGSLSADGKEMLAVSVVAIKKADVAAKKAREREEWRRNGAGGLVKSVDAAAGTIVIATNATGAAKDLTVEVRPSTVLRRYALDSTKFDDARPAPIGEIHAGDQLRVRGTRSTDGATLAADEIVSGTFLNLAGVIASIDPAARTVAVDDLATKKPVVVKITAESQVRKLPLQMAQRLAALVKAPAAGASAGAAAQKPQEASGSSAPAVGNGPQRVDLQQRLAQLPPATFADLQKGDAVMIVATGQRDGIVTAINLLSGVEPILEASPKDGRGAILTPWSLNSAPAEGPGANP